MSYSPIPDALTAGRTNLGALFRSRVAAHPDAVAVIDGDRSYTYRELDQRSNQLANFLQQSGLTTGDRVAILARNCAEYIEVELAVAKTGIVLAALNWRLGARELTHCISLVEPKLIIAQPEFTETLGQLELADHILIETGETYEKAFAGQPDTCPNFDIDPEVGLVILYTSGTTGLPKGALISHRAMIARAMCFASEMEIPVGDNFIAWAPLYHMASTDQSLTMLLRGGTVHIVDGYQPDQIIDILEHIPMRYLILMPGMVGPFADALTQRNATVKGVGICGAMADLIPRHHIAAVTSALNAPYLNTFGATETGLPPGTGNTIPVGVAPTSLPKRQSAFCELRLVDPDDKDVPVGTPGEVALRGPTLFSGYWNADETNAHDFRNGWFHMGDVMRRNPDGTLDYVDRVKYMIKSGGENIYPAEIEQVLLTDERVTEAVVVKQVDEKWGEVPVVFIVSSDNSLGETDLLELCHRDLSSFKRPKAFFFIEESELPRSTTGKVQRHVLEERLTADPH